LELKVFLYHTPDELLQLQQVLTVAVITIGGGLPVLPGVASSCGLSSVSEASVSMLAVLSWANKFLVGTVLCVVLTAAGAAVIIIFFGVQAASLLLWRLRLLLGSFFAVCGVVC
jgi:hypothetical protein